MVTSDGGRGGTRERIAAARATADRHLRASCRLFAIEPWSYLRDIFRLLPQWPEHTLLDLAPLNWNKTKTRDDVRTLLYANPFRKLTLDARG